MADRPGDGGEKGDKPKGLFEKEICVREELKIAVAVAIEKFRQSDEQKELQFPSSFTSTERAYVHRHCQTLGLVTKSRGKGSKRYLTAYKKERASNLFTSDLKVSRQSADLISSLLKKFPVTNKEKQELGQKKLFKTSGHGHEQNKVLAREHRLLLSTSPQIPPKARDSDISRTRSSLPIASYREEILKHIKKSQVVLIAGETGCGKTTQVGQFILEDCHKNQTPCRLVCTQPRRISAMSVAERVAAERGERIGGTVGYQIRLESRLSPKTLLLFCTNGVLLRLLMVGHKALSNVTHVIVDEIHERDRFSDFLLICIRDLLKAYKHIKVILMSAVLNINLFQEYFGKCPIVHVPASCHEVGTYFLEDVLSMTGYMNKHMKKLAQEAGITFGANDSHQRRPSSHNDENNVNDSIKSEGKDVEEEEAQAEGVYSDDEVEVEEETELNDEDQIVESISTEAEYSSNDDKRDKAEDEVIQDHYEDEADDGSDVMEQVSLEDLSGKDGEGSLDPEVRQEMDNCIASAWMNGDEDSFEQIIHLILNENVNVNYRHSETKMTTLMVAAARGHVNLVEQLLEFGADFESKDPKQHWTALDWARNFKQEHVIEIIEHFKIAKQGNEDATKPPEEAEQSLMSEEEKQRLEFYHNTFDDDKVDISLILCLLTYICRNKEEGAILVFLPGYDDIITLRDRLADDKEFSKRSKYIIFTLHSMLQPSNQRKAFRRPPHGVRKIILATNIAETSITIDDVVHVIDSGKVKEKSYDAITSVSALRCVWISKASAVQRKGRAGRCQPGTCYHLFSRARLQSMAMYQEAELLRTPIHELALQTKLLAPVNVSIADFLSKAPEAPPYLMVRNSVTLLKAIDALDEDEELTELGKLLVELPVDPRLGKMIIFGLLLKCLDPVLVIAASLAYKDPFVLPTLSSHRRLAAIAKDRFSARSLSDHIAILRACQGWVHAREEGRDRDFCFRNFISPAVMEMVSGMRNQLIAHLRSLGFIRPRGPGDIKDLNSNSRNWSVIKAIICGGMYPTLMQVDRETNKLVSENEKKVRIHTSSVLQTPSNRGASIVDTNINIVKNLPFDWVVYDEANRMHTAVQIRCLSVVPAVVVALLAGPCMSCDVNGLSLHSSRDTRPGEKAKFVSENSDSDNDADAAENGKEDSALMKVDDWIVFQGEDEILQLIMALKTKLLSALIRRITAPGRVLNQADDAIVRCVVSVLTEEESNAGLPNPVANTRLMRRLSDNAKEVSSKPMGKNQHMQNNHRQGSERKFTIQAREERNLQKPGKESAAMGTDKEGHKSSGNVKKGRRYFIVKCNNEKNLEISMNKGIWATTKGNEKKLDRAFHESEDVFLIFSIQGSGHFQGFARMTSGVTDRHAPEFGSANLGGTFSVEWIHREDIAFQHTHHLTNPWNENKKVQISRDGQELEPTVGDKLCCLWEQMLPPSSPTGPPAQPVSPNQQHQRPPRFHHAQGNQVHQQQQPPHNHPQGYAVMDNHPPSHYYEAPPGHMYGPPYVQTDIHGVPTGFPQVAMYPQHIPGYPPQGTMAPHFQPQEMYSVPPQHYINPRAPEFSPRGMQYYPAPPYQPGDPQARYPFGYGRTRPINITRPPR